MRAWLLGATVGAIGWSGGCDDGRSGATAWLERGERAHAEATAALARNEPAEAQRALDEWLASAVPPAMDAVDARRVRQDAYFRLAVIALAQHDATAALKAADAALALGPSSDVETANAWVARGRALEQLGRATEAAAAYLAAMRINEVLLEAALGQAAPPKGEPGGSR